jgi:hypothetical protein
MVSFDVVSLFTKVPVEDSLTLLGHHFTDDILALFKLVLTSIYFCVNGQYYEQTDYHQAWPTFSWKILKRKRLTKPLSSPLASTDLWMTPSLSGLMGKQV